MENKLAVDIISGTTKKALISTILMDEDLTTMAKVPQEVTKESDLSLAKKM